MRSVFRKNWDILTTATAAAADADAAVVAAAAVVAVAAVAATATAETNRKCREHNSLLWRSSSSIGRRMSVLLPALL